MATDTSGPTIKTDFEGFKKLSGEFFRATDPTATPVEYEAVEAGHKAVTLAYLGLENLTGQEGYEAVIILRMASERLIKAEQRLPTP